VNLGDCGDHVVTCGRVGERSSGQWQVPQECDGALAQLQNVRVVAVDEAVPVLDRRDGRDGQGMAQLIGGNGVQADADRIVSHGWTTDIEADSQRFRFGSWLRKVHVAIGDD
jgi:hypothetical protein